MKISQRFALTYIRTKFRILSFFSTRLAAETAFRLFCTPNERDVKELPPIFQRAEQIDLPFGGYDIHGYRWNPGGARKVMIIHGFRSAAINFAAYVEPLLKRNMEVLVFDGPAHGRSSGKRMNAVIYSDFIRHVHQVYGPIDSFVAHSLGGLSLSLALAEIPHDAHTRVALLAPATETATAVKNFFRVTALNLHVQRHFTRIITTLSGKEIPEISVTEAMKQIRATVLWIHDERDEVTPLTDAGAVRGANYPNINFVITNGLGHSGLYRNSSVIQQVVAFI